MRYVLKIIKVAIGSLLREAGKKVRKGESEKSFLFIILLSVIFPIIFKKEG